MRHVKSKHDYYLKSITNTKPIVNTVYQSEDQTFNCWVMWEDLIRINLNLKIVVGNEMNVIELAKT